MKQYAGTLNDLGISRGTWQRIGERGVSMSALWGELAASVAVDAASRGVGLELDIDDVREPSEDPSRAMRVYRNLALAALRLTARDACLRVRVRASGDAIRTELESVCPGVGAGRARLYRATRSVPSEAGFALQAARTHVRPLGGSVDAHFMQDLGVRITVEVPRRAELG